MSQSLPQHLLQLFQPREHVPYLPPIGKLPYERNVDQYTGGTPVATKYDGIGKFLNVFEQAKDTPSLPAHSETREERRERKRKEREEALQYKLERDLALWDPKADSNTTGDAFRTIFVGRISYETTESKLRREFEAYGPIKTIRIVQDTTSGKARGYAFIEYEDEKSMHEAYKMADGLKIDGHRVKVDIERGRTIKGWKPQRLGGGFAGRKARAKGENPRKKEQTASSTKSAVNGDDVRRDRGTSRDEREQQQRNRPVDRERDHGARSYRDDDRNGNYNDRRDRDRGGDRYSGSRDSGRSGRPVDFAPPPRGAFDALGNVPDRPVDDRRSDPRRSKRSRSREGTIGGRYSRDENQAGDGRGGGSGGHGTNYGNGDGGYRERRRGNFGDRY